MKLPDYISGSRSGEEANRIERQAMRDPFLYEALDGYERVPHDTGKALRELQKEIRKRTSNRRKHLAIWSSAASILILMLAGGYFLIKSGETTFDDLVSQDQPPVHPHITVTDTISVESPSISVPEPEKITKAEAVKPDPKPEADIHVAGTGKVFGIIIDDMGDPLIGASVVVKGTTNGTVTNFDGYFELNATPGDELQISFIGYQTLDVPVKEGSMQVAMKEDVQRLDDVVVTGYGTQRKMATTGSIRQVKADKVKKAPRKPQPEGGYKAFKQYIQENKAYTGKGKVVLIFSIDRWGRPENIRVKSSTDEEASEDAIDLLKEGPDWIKGKKNKEIKYTFRF